MPSNQQLNSQRDIHHHGHVPYWKGDWRFWMGVAWMFLAMIIYVMTDNLAWRPRLQTPLPPSNVPGK